MAILKFNNIGVKAVSACVPKKVRFNKDLTYLIPPEEIDKVINSIGIEERRYADQNTTASDLCEKAARQIIKDNNIKVAEIDALIFVSQTSDYHQPATAPLLQYKLGIPNTCLSFDINLACSGYVYGLATAFSFAQQESIRNVLLLVGETMSKTVSQNDKVSTPLFGDAGTATLICKGDFGESIFSLHSDGAGSDVIKMKYGGYRHPSCPEGFIEYSDDEGNTRSGEQFYMNGLDVFNFGMSVEPKDIKNLIKEAGISPDELDLLVYHQANRFMTDFFSKKLKISSDKTPYSLKKYGNTSSASIPLTISSEMADGNYKNREKSILTGFGAGLSWASVFLNLSRTKIFPVIEY